MSVVKVKGIPFDFSGVTLIIPPMSLGTLEQLAGRLSESHDDIMDPEYVGLVIDAAHSALRRNYPEMTRAEVADMIDVGNMQEVMACTMDVSGLKRKSLESAMAGENEGGLPGE